MKNNTLKSFYYISYDMYSKEWTMEGFNFAL